MRDAVLRGVRFIGVAGLALAIPAVLGEAIAAGPAHLRTVLQTNGENDIIGRWVDPQPYGLGVMTIKRGGNAYSMLAEPSQGKPFSLPLKRVGKSRFDYVGDPSGSYVVILPSGKLDTRDRDGEVAVLDVALGGPGDGSASAAAVVSAQQRVLCNHDLSCTVSGKLQEATSDCQRAIQRASKWTYRWVGSGSPFGGYRWNPKAPTDKGLVDFYGDRVQFQNGFGAWQNYTYVCTYDMHNGRIAGLALRPGRL